MLQEAQHATPLQWLQTVAMALQWPVIVAAAFWLGRYVQRLETRLSKAESNLSALIERHMPAIHRALAEIRGMLSGMAGRD